MTFCYQSAPPICVADSELVPVTAGVEDVPLPVTVSVVTPIPQELATLPHTGTDSFTSFLFGVALMAGGALLLIRGKRLQR